jgi:hypothetical protein
MINLQITLVAPIPLHRNSLGAACAKRTIIDGRPASRKCLGSECIVECDVTALTEQSLWSIATVRSSRRFEVTMKSADEIRSTLLKSVRQLYTEPHLCVSTLGELDVALFWLHWHFADASNCLEQFVAARLDVFKASIEEWREVHLADGLHSVLDDPMHFKPIIDEWKRLDAMLGIETS